MTPVLTILVYKAIKGFQMVKRGFARPAMQTYYLVSWAFYSAYVVQASFLLIFTWDVFNEMYRSLSLFNILIAFPLWGILAFYMQWLDRQSVVLNTKRIRKIERRA